MELFIEGLQNIARFDVFCALLVGSIGGVIIGAVPGVGAGVAIAIILPATFQLEPIVGLTLLLGIYGASMYGGAIPAILINTPGTPVNALTTYDGYPMSCRGESRRALSLAYSASFCGGVIAVFCLIMITPFLAKVAPLFGSRDIFMAAVLGVVMVILSHRKQTAVAGMLMFFGIFLNTIGMEMIQYSQRYTFGIKGIISGIELIPVLIGLFALSQAFMLLIKQDEQPDLPKVTGNPFKGFMEVLKYPRTVSISAGFGVIMGIIPGVGEFLAQFFSYSLARVFSKNPEKFGKGAPEGIIASEAANNAVPPAAMIPLLALGIPGEVLTAMMLSVFYVHNIIPGPALFNTRPEFPVSLYICLLVANFINIVFLLLTTNKLLYIVRVPTRILGVFILTLALIGVYSIRNSFVDCIIAVIFGVVGYILKRLDLPLVPLILGMVLGRIMDNKLRSGMARLEGPLDLINRPISGTIFAIIVLVLVIHFFSLFWEKKKRTADEKK